MVNSYRTSALNSSCCIFPAIAHLITVKSTWNIIDEIVVVNIVKIKAGLGP